MIPSDRIFLSSLAFEGDRIEDSDWFRNGNNIEFTSSGYSSSSRGLEMASSYTGQMMLHNYFPGSFVSPFVLNIATLDESAWLLTEKHIKRNIALTGAHSNPKFFGVHVGFKFELRVNEIGGKLRPSLDKESVRYDIMIQRLKDLGDFANERGVRLLIENNVMRPDSLIDDVCPLFGVTVEEMMEIIENVSPTRIGWILDTAHLKVSAKTLARDVSTEMEQILVKPEVVHHSDNDGLSDTNQVPGDNYWFRPFLSDYIDSVHVIEVAKPVKEELDNFIKQLNDSYI